MYFYWQKAHLGNWSPVKAVEPPGKAAYGGHTMPVTGVVKLGDVEAGFDLDSLASFYPVEGARA